MLLVGKEFRNQRFPDCTLSPSIPPSAFGEALIKRFFAYKEFFPQHLWGEMQLNAVKIWEYPKVCVNLQTDVR